MLTDPLRWLEIDLSAIASNVQVLSSLLKDKTQFCAVVKSNAYGHGLLPVAKTVVGAGADWLAVVDADEALTLRAADTEVPILITGVVPPAQWEALAREDVRILITDLDQVKLLEAYRGPTLRVHIKVETGLSRLGIYPEELSLALATLEACEAVKLEGIASHLAAVEEQELEFTMHQLAMFNAAITQTQSTLIRHTAATAAVLQLPESHFDMVRSGIGIYGLWPSSDVRETMQQIDSSVLLQPALSYKTRLVQTKTVKLGSSIGYGRTYRTDKETPIGVVAVGYADGYDRKLSNQAYVLIQGEKCPIVGRVAMNMCMVDCSRVPQAQVGDTVTLIGKDGSSEVTADDIAAWSDTINYEVVTRIPASILRIYNN